MDGDPIVITRYWYRPASSAGGRFNDNRRLHLFVVDVQTKQVRQLTSGNFYEHSIDWSPDGTQLAFLSNHEPDPDFVNYDIFIIDVASAAVRQLTHTRSNEYRPIWSPDGKSIAVQGLKRPMTSSETNTEDTHVWTIDVASGQRREIGAAIDNRQGPPQWSADGRSLYFTVQSRGSVGLYRMSARGRTAERVLPAADVAGTVCSFGVGKDGVVAFAMATPSSPAELYVTIGDRADAADVAQPDLLGHKTIGGRRCVGLQSPRRPRDRSVPDEARAARRRWQASDDPDDPWRAARPAGPGVQPSRPGLRRARMGGADGELSRLDRVRAGVFGRDRARSEWRRGAGHLWLPSTRRSAKYPWIDRERGSASRAAATAASSRTGWSRRPIASRRPCRPRASPTSSATTTCRSTTTIWSRSTAPSRTGRHRRHALGALGDPLRHRVKTPVMFVHGDNDQLVNPAEIEQFFIALKDVGVETVMVRYPREGHGMRENRHIADFIDRSIAWYDRHFQSTAPRRTN